jgi:SAM-dependent methyltransferase
LIAPDCEGGFSDGADYQQVRDDLRRAYDGAADRRDRRDKQPWKQKERAAFLRRLEQASCRRLLEIGAGTGQDSEFFAAHNLDVVATDMSAAMVARCRDKGLHARVMDFSELGFPAGSFDAVYAMNCLLHVPNAELPAVLASIARVLVPGGLFFLGVCSGDERAGEGAATSDDHVPARFFSWRTDDQIAQFAAESFDIVDFHIAQEGSQHRFQSLTLRRPIRSGNTGRLPRPGFCHDGLVVDGERAAADYDAMGTTYRAASDDGSFNAYYERPATISLVGDVTGRRVLEAGCGPGALTEWFCDHGASVTAFDVSPEMVRLTRERIGQRARVLTADLAEPLVTVANASVDLVVASLVMHYLADWAVPLAEFYRVLPQDGAVVFSTHHPAMDWQLHSPDDYFAVKQVTETWHKGGRPFTVTFWRRPLTAITAAVSDAGFIIDRMVEPPPLPALQQRNPRDYHKICTRPAFLFFRLRKRSEAGQ